MSFHAANATAGRPRASHNVAKGTRFIDEFKQLNFVGDQEMEAQLERVRQEFLQRSAEQYRDDPSARVRLEQALQGLAEEASKLARQDAQELVQRFGEVGHRKFCLAA